MLRQWRVITILLATVGTLSFTLHAQQATSANQPAAFSQASQGRVLFTTNCAACHGADAHGGERGPDLTASEVQQLSDSGLTHIIQHGISGGMPSFRAFTPEKIKAIVDYLRVQQGKGAVVTLDLPGSKSAGELLFFGRAHCSTCHMVNGKGGFIGSDLSLYGSHESAAQIRGVITDPQDKLPAQSNATKVVTRSGETVAGIVRSNDNFSISLQTLDGSFQFFQKSDLQQIDLGSHSLMPDNYGSTLSTVELNDLVSYILSVGTENARHATTQPSRSRNGDFDRD